MKENKGESKMEPAVWKVDVTIDEARFAILERDTLQFLKEDPHSLARILGWTVDEDRCLLAYMADIGLSRWDNEYPCPNGERIKIPLYLYDYRGEKTGRFRSEIQPLGEWERVR